eukprot:g2696.t1
MQKALFVEFHQADALTDTQWVVAQCPYALVKLGETASAQTKPHADGDCAPRWSTALDARHKLSPPAGVGSPVDIEVWHDSAALDSLIGKTRVAWDAIPALGQDDVVSFRQRLALEECGVLEVTLFRADADLSLAQAWLAYEAALDAAPKPAAGPSAPYDSSIKRLPQAATGGSTGADTDGASAAAAEGAPRATAPPPTVTNCWSDPNISDLPVRGASYMTDSIKRCTTEPAFACCGIDLLRPSAGERRRSRPSAAKRLSKARADLLSKVRRRSKSDAGADADGGGDADGEGDEEAAEGANAAAPATGSIADHPNNFVQRRRGAPPGAGAGARAGAASAAAGGGDGDGPSPGPDAPFQPDDFYLLLNFDIGFANLVLYFSPRRPTPSVGDAAFDALAARFFAPGPAADAFRRQRLKILPRVVEGPWAVRKAVGFRPAILGDRVKQSYHHGDGFLEVRVDISSSVIATKLLKLCTKVVTRLTMDLAFIIQGEGEDELPERVLGCARFHRLDLGSVVEQDSMRTVNAEAAAALAAGGARVRAGSADIDAMGADLARDLELEAAAPMPASASAAVAGEAGGASAGVGEPETAASGDSLCRITTNRTARANANVIACDQERDGARWYRKQFKNQVNVAVCVENTGFFEPDLYKSVEDSAAQFCTGGKLSMPPWRYGSDLNCADITIHYRKIAVTPATIWLPISYAHAPIEAYRMLPVPFEKKSGNIASVVRQCFKERKQMIADVMQAVHFGCFGGCLHNKGFSEVGCITGSIGNGVSDYVDLAKECMLSKYKFYLSFENTKDTNYTTEKLWQPLKMGTVPHLGDYLAEASKNKDLYMKHHAWRTMITMPEGAQAVPLRRMTP